MTQMQRQRLLDLRKRSKRGGSLFGAETAFVLEMWTRHRDEYREVEKELQEWARTAPWHEII